MDVPVLADQQRLTSGLCGNRMQPKDLLGAMEDRDELWERKSVLKRERKRQGTPCCQHVLMMMRRNKFFNNYSFTNTSLHGGGILKEEHFENIFVKIFTILLLWFVFNFNFIYIFSFCLFVHFIYLFNNSIYLFFIMYFFLFYFFFSLTFRETQILSLDPEQNSKTVNRRDIFRLPFLLGCRFLFKKTIILVFEKNPLTFYIKLLRALQYGGTRSPMARETWVQSQVESYQRL